MFEELLSRGKATTYLRWSGNFSTGFICKFHSACNCGKKTLQIVWALAELSPSLWFRFLYDTKNEKNYGIRLQPIYHHIQYRLNGIVHESTNRIYTHNHTKWNQQSDNNQIYVPVSSKRGYKKLLYTLSTLTAFLTAAMDAICSTTVPVWTRLHWSTDSRPVWVGWDGMACVVEREMLCGWSKQNKLDKDCSQHSGYTRALWVTG